MEDCPKNCDCKVFDEIKCNFDPEENLKNTFLSYGKSILRYKKISIKNLKKISELIKIENRYLVYLNLSNGYINEIENLKIINTIIIDLGKNQIQIIKSDVFIQKKLMYLYLQNNPITTIQPKSFKNLINLQYLDLSETKIKILKKFVFENLKKLRILQFMNNKIELIEKDTFIFNEQLEELNLLKTNLKDNIPMTFAIRLKHIKNFYSTNIKFCSIVEILNENDEKICEKIKFPENNLIVLKSFRIFLWISLLLVVFFSIISICFKIFSKIKNYLLIYLFMNLSDILIVSCLFILIIIDMKYRNIFQFEYFIWRNSLLCKIIQLIIEINIQYSSLIIFYFSLKILIIIKINRKNLSTAKNILFFIFLSFFLGIFSYGIIRFFKNNISNPYLSCFALEFNKLNIFVNTLFYCFLNFIIFGIFLIILKKFFQLKNTVSVKNAKFTYILNFQVYFIIIYITHTILWIIVIILGYHYNSINLFFYLLFFSIPFLDVVNFFQNFSLNDNIHIYKLTLLITPRSLISSLFSLKSDLYLIIKEKKEENIKEEYDTFFFIFQILFFLYKIKEPDELKIVRNRFLKFVINFFYLFNYFFYKIKKNYNNFFLYFLRYKKFECFEKKWFNNVKSSSQV